MKPIVYHYVRGETHKPPNYYHLNINDFRSQLDFFEEEYGFVEKCEFIDSINGRVDQIPSGVVLTFDDGLRDHYDEVFPELKSRNLWGIFYVPTGPYETGKLLNVHRIHHLLGEVTGPDLLTHTKAVVTEEMIPHKRRLEYRNETYHRHDDTEPTKQVKRILNFFIGKRYQTKILDMLEEIIGIDQVDVDDYYMTPQEIRSMHDAGMIIGGHTVTHPVLSKLNVTDQRRQILDSIDFLDDTVGGLRERTFCYPYGDYHTFDDNTKNILNEVNCTWSFMVESTDITLEHLRERPLELPRFNCNEFPFGTVSGSIGSES